MFCNNFSFRALGAIGTPVQCVLGATSWKSECFGDAKYDSHLVPKINKDWRYTFTPQY